MAAPQQQTHQTVYTEEEYFRFSETAEERWEFTPVGPSGPDGNYLGRICMMAGGTDDHVAIIGNIVSALHPSLAPKGCRTYASDMRVHAGSGKNLFPDVAVVCGPREYHQGRLDTLTNPILVAEVLSPSTASYDLGAKFRHYQTVPTLQDYLLIFQDQAQALLYTRQDDNSWTVQIVTGLESAVWLPSLGINLALADIYVLIEFEIQPGEE